MLAVTPLWLSCSAINYEIVIVDDNSQDNTQGVVHQLQKLYGDDKIVREVAQHVLPHEATDASFPYRS